MNHMYLLQCVSVVVQHGNTAAASVEDWKTSFNFVAMIMCADVTVILYRVLNNLL